MAFLDSLIASDFDLFDGVETVTWERRDVKGNTTSIAGVRVLRRAIKGDPVVTEKGIMYLTDAARVHVRRSDLPNPPRRDDRLLFQDGTIWQVMTDNTETLNNRYACECRKVSA